MDGQTRVMGDCILKPGRWPQAQPPNAIHVIAEEHHTQPYRRPSVTEVAVSLVYD
jgi:hypothetical protein